MLRKILLIVFACLITITAGAQCVINATASYTPTSVCLGDTIAFNVTSNVSGVSYNWSGPNSFVSSSSNPTVDSANPSSHQGNYTVITSKVGCVSDTDTVVIQVNEPVIPNIVPDTPICSGDTLRIALVYPGGGFEAISFAPNTSLDTTNTGVLIYPNALKHTHTGIYKYITTSSNGCVSDTLTFNIPGRAIPYKDTPVASAVNNPICKGDTLRLTASSNSAVDRYYWEGPNAQSYNMKDVVVNGYNLTGKQMFVLRTDSNYCMSEPDTLVVDVLNTANPVVSIMADPGFIVGTNVQVTFTANVQNEGFNNIYQWRKNGVNIPNAVNKTYQAVTTQTIQQGDILTVWVQAIPTCANIDTALSNPTSLNIKLDVKEVTATTPLQLYPNPVKDVLSVTGVENAKKLIITNLVGETVDLRNRMTIGKESVKINTANLQPGIYILRYGNRAVKFIKTN